MIELMRIVRAAAARRQRHAGSRMRCYNNSAVDDSVPDYLVAVSYRI